ncbi:MAG: DUF881 domain-containing protein [Nocardioides sp.]
MAPTSHASPEQGTRDAGAPRGRWRFGTPLVVIACGALFVTSAANSEGTDLRPGRYTDLGSLVAAENREYEQLEDRVRELTDEVDRLTGQVGDSKVTQLQADIEAMKQPAGLTPVAGPGLTITLSDAPADIINSSTQPIELLIVHQQDIQAVLNAMWKGGAEAVTLQGRRVVSTTGVKCEGNAVLIQGRAYPQPYTIVAIGNPAALEAAVLQDDYLGAYRRDASLPDVSVGFEMAAAGELEMPAYDGLTNLTYAEPIG